MAYQLLAIFADYNFTLARKYYVNIGGIILKFYLSLAPEMCNFIAHSHCWTVICIPLFLKFCDLLEALHLFVTFSFNQHYYIYVSIYYMKISKMLNKISIGLLTAYFANLHSFFCHQNVSASTKIICWCLVLMLPVQIRN